MVKRNTTKPSNTMSKVIIGALLIVLAIYMFVTLSKGNHLHPDNLSTDLGVVGAFLYRVLRSLAGYYAVLVPLALLIGGIQLIIPRLRLKKVQELSASGIMILILAWGHLGVDPSVSFSDGLAGMHGGLIGASASFIFVKLLGTIGARLMIFALIILLIYIGTEGRLMLWARDGFKYVGPFSKNFAHQLKNFIFIDEEKEGKKKKQHRLPTHPSKKKSNKQMVAKEKSAPKKKPIPSRAKVNFEDDSPTLFIENLKEFHEELKEADKEEKVREFIESGFADAAAAHVTSKDQIYHLPSLTLLEEISQKSIDIDQDDINENAQILEQTLADFGVRGQINEISVGPTITEYEFQPAPGIKVSKITNLADDLALSLAASGIRIQAPIPGKAAVGIEVPNRKARVVRIKEVLNSDVFQKSGSKMTVALGKDISGHSIVTDLGAMPHMLIAGSTGSGKSVCLNALIVSILYKAKPHEVKFLMIDPKMVELGNYNGIPHLLAPVVTDSKKAAATLRWAVKEMEKRYERFAEAGVKDMTRYNTKCIERQAMGEFTAETETMPNIVIIIDELADLMMVAPADVEDAICRLAQMARAAGMHLVIATQRPSVDVITGIIKANIPSRIAFAVSSQVDSRTILDMGGAEKLLGRGDMLFYPTGMAKPKRIQGVYVTDNEIDAVVADVKGKASPHYNEEVAQIKAITANHDNEKSSGDITDELLPEACQLFIENGQASISMLQRHFRIGYTRAARIIDQLEELGYVGPYEGSKPRQIKIKLDEFHEIFGE